MIDFYLIKKILCNVYYGADTNLQILTHLILITMPQTRYYYHTYFTDGKLGIANSRQRQASHPGFWLTWALNHYALLLLL